MSLRIRASVQRGVALGFKFSVVYGVVGLIAAVLQHNVFRHDARRLSIPRMLGVFLVGGAITGALGGLLAVFVRSRLAAYFAGVVAGYPTMALAYLAMYGLSDPSEFRDVSVGISLLLGGVGGVIVYEIFHDRGA